MPPSPLRLTPSRLIGAGLRRAPLRSLAAAGVALLAAGALFAALLLLTGMNRQVQANLNQLGAELIVVPKGRAAAVQPLLTGQAVSPLPADVNLAQWKQLLKQGKVVGIKRVEGLSLAAGGRGEVTTGQASAVLLYMERWASPLIAVQEITAAIPDAEVVVAEHGVRSVTRNLQPIIRLVTIAAGIALLGAVLLTGLLTAISVAERRRELGMMRAMGATRSLLIGITLGEAAVPALGGALAGLLLAGGAIRLPGFAAQLAQTLTTRETLLIGVGALCLVLVVTGVAALGPALRAARMDPLDAVRRGK